MVNKGSSFTWRYEMKLQFAYTGDVHSFVIAMMQGHYFTLTGEKKSLVVQPNLKKEGLSIKSANVNSEMVMTIPVTLPEFGGEALMSFQYDVKSTEVAKAVAMVEEVVGMDAIAGVSCPADLMPEAVEDGVRFFKSESFPVPDVKTVEAEGFDVYIVMNGAKLYKSIAPRPAIEGRPAIMMSLFQRGSRDYSSLTIKFE